MQRRHLPTQFRPSTRRGRRLGLIASGLSLCAALLAATPAAAGDLAITTVPTAPDFHEPLKLVVSGAGCYPSLTAPVADMAHAIVAADFQDICSIIDPPRPPEPFRLEAAVPPLLPGTYTIRVRDLERGTFSEAPLTVYRTSNVSLEVPEIVTDAERPVLRLGAINSCAILDLKVGQQTVDVDYASDCPFEPPPRSLHFIDITLDAPLPAGIYDVRLFDHADGGVGLVHRAMRVWDADGCVPSPTRLCLRDGRFAVSVVWHDFSGHTGSGHATPLPGNEGSGLVWFFGADNTELTLKLLDGCGLNGHWWTFVSSSSTVEYSVTVTDTKTGRERRYDHAPGIAAPLVEDVEAFPCP
jgi:hypothetical protein